MSAAEFRPYFETLVRTYAADNVRAGRWTEAESIAQSREQTEKLLPLGVNSPGHYLYTVVGGPRDEPVGVIWLAVEPRGGFIYDLQIAEAHRRQGYAEEAMRLVEQVAREKGAARIGLHVFGENAGARKLYQKLGYVETNVLMAKSLSP